jgi:hypothetical protein
MPCDLRIHFCLKFSHTHLPHWTSNNNVSTSKWMSCLTHQVAMFPHLSLSPVDWLLPNKGCIDFLKNSWAIASFYGFVNRLISTSFPTQRYVSYWWTGTQCQFLTVGFFLPTLPYFWASTGKKENLVLYAEGVTPKSACCFSVGSWIRFKWEERCLSFQ